MSTHGVVLTDADSGEILESGSVDASSGLKLAGSSDWSVPKRTLAGGPSDGVDVVDLNNGELSMSILPTRGMGLWRGTYHGIPIEWKSPVARPVHPSLVNLQERSGLGWNESFLVGVKSGLRGQDLVEWGSFERAKRFDSESAAEGYQGIIDNLEGLYTRIQPASIFEE